MSGASGRRIKLTECRWEHAALVAHENCALTRMRLLRAWRGAGGSFERKTDIQLKSEKSADFAFSPC